MSNTFKVSPVGVENISRELYRRAGIIPAAMGEVALLIQEEIDDNFIGYGRWNGSTTDILSGGNTKWTPLAKSTVRQYKAKGITNLNPTLSRSSGGLRDSTIASAQGMRVVINSNKVYAAAQHYGADIQHPGGTPYINLGNSVRFLKKDGNYPEGVKFTKPHVIHIPARPFVTINRATLADISEILVKRMARA